MYENPIFRTSRSLEPQAVAVGYTTRKVGRRELRLRQIDDLDHHIDGGWKRLMWIGEVGMRQGVMQRQVLHHWGGFDDVPRYDKWDDLVWRLGSLYNVSGQDGSAIVIKRQGVTDFRVIEQFDRRLGILAYIALNQFGAAAQRALELDQIKIRINRTRVHARATRLGASEVRIDVNGARRIKGVVAPLYLVVHLDCLHMGGRSEVVLASHMRPGHGDR
ncbi:hypothetical protein D3C76_961150 [compost metagenome]